jgi:hypothetical protein
MTALHLSYDLVALSGSRRGNGNTTMPYDGPVIAILTPCFGGLVTAAYHASMQDFQLACLAKDIKLRSKMIVDDGLITRARAELVAWFLDSDATHLLFVDADIGFKADQFFRLLAFDVDVAAAAYPAKRVDFEKVARDAIAGRPNLESASLTYVVAWKEGRQVEAKNGFARARFAGTGFLLIKRKAIERLCAAHPELRYRSTQPAASFPREQVAKERFALFDPIIEPNTGEYLSEDYAFCKRWTDLGGEIWIDLHSRLDHVGPCTFTGDLSTQFTTMAPST